MKTVNSFLAIIIVSLCVSGCATSRRPLTARSELADSSRTEVFREVITVIDTQFVVLPRQTAQTVTTADSSHLETDFAVSDAFVDSLGQLHHTLDTKQQAVSVPVKKTNVRESSKSEAVRDSKRVEPEIVEVERKLSWYQALAIRWFGWLLAVLLALLAVTFRRPLLALIRRFI